MGNRLYFGDNLEVLRGRIAPESVDLVYLDPPFNSKAQYNVLFKSPAGAAAAAQASAFKDTWHWGDEAEFAYSQVMASGSSAARMLSALRSSLGESDMMAYLAMMTVRLVELHRVLRPTGSLYLHCDPTASHYLKILLDGIFGASGFRNEIIWQRAASKSLMKRRLPNNHDVILFYAGPHAVWNEEEIFKPYDLEDLPKKAAEKYSLRDADGRRYQLTSLINPNSDRPNLTYEFMGVTRVWRWTRERMERAARDGLIVQPAPGRVPRLKRYLDEQRGIPLDDVWIDIPPLNSQARERLGYPTQKPLALLDRIIRASTKEGAMVLDPFCGCGTTIHAAQALGRQWCGIDVTHYAITVIETRLRRHFPELGKIAVHGRPRDMEGARELARRDKYQFQWWANWLVGAQNYREHHKGADRGIDGEIYFRNGPWGTGRVIVSVKGGDSVGPDMVRALLGTLERERAELGLLVMLTPPTPKMKAEAAAVGIASKAVGKRPRLQIATVEDLLAGKRPNLPEPFDFADPGLRAPAAAKKDDAQLSFMLPFPGQRGGRKGKVLEFIDPRVQVALAE